MLDKDLNIKIANFSSAKLNEVNGIRQFYASSDMLFLPPELSKKEFPFDGEKVDVFALAIVLFTYAMKRYPTDKEKFAAE